MKFKIEAISILTLEQTPGDQTSKHVSIEITMGTDGEYGFHREGVPTKTGVKAMTLALAQGLVANIHASHEKGYWDSAQHFRYVINELERGFSTVADISTGIYQKNKEKGGRS